MVVISKGADSVSPGIWYEYDFSTACTGVELEYMSLAAYIGAIDVSSAPKVDTIKNSLLLIFAWKNAMLAWS